MMKDMKMSDADKKGMEMGPVTAGKEDYPYGLRIRLTEAEIKKLGLDSIPAVGDEVELTAKVKVSGTHSDVTEEGNNRSLELQITHMDLETGDEEASESDKAQTMFPSQAQK